MLKELVKSGIKYTIEYIMGLEKDLANTRKGLAYWKNEAEGQIEINRKYCQTNNDLKSKYESTSNSLSCAKGKVKELENSNSILVAQNMSLQAALEDLKSETQGLKRRRDELRQSGEQTLDLALKLERTERALVEVTQENYTLKDELAKGHEANTKLNKDLTEVRKNHALLVQDLGLVLNQRDDLTKATQRLETELAEKTKYGQYWHDSYCQYDGKLLEACQKVEQLEKQIQSLQTNCKGWQDVANERLKELESKRAALTKLLAALTKLLAEKESLQKALDVLKAELNAKSSKFPWPTKYIDGRLYMSYDGNNWVKWG